MDKHELSPRNFLARNLVNQRQAKASRDAERKLFGESKKQKRARARAEFPLELSATTFQRSVDHILSESATLEDVDYVLRHQDEFPLPDGVDIGDRIRNIKDTLCY